MKPSSALLSIVLTVLCHCVTSGQAPVARKTTLHSVSAQKMQPEMQQVLKKWQSLHGKPIEDLSPEEARLQPTIQDAAAALMKEKKIDSASPGIDTSGIDIPALGGTIHARLYKPASGNNWPIVLYFHGGGFVTGTINDYNSSAEALVVQSGALIVSVEYRKGPENRFPLAHRDCFAAYQWALQSGDTWGGNPRRIAVAGEGAGGNLAASVCLMARQMGMQQPKAQVLIYPIAGNNTRTSSYLRNARAKPLNAAIMRWNFKNYLADTAEINDTRINLLKADLTDLPPATIITADLDPLHDEGEMLAQNMTKAGDAVLYKNYPGVIHGFFGLGAVVPQAMAAEILAGIQLKQAFDSK